MSDWAEIAKVVREAFDRPHLVYPLDERIAFLNCVTEAPCVGRQVLTKAFGHRNSANPSDVVASMLALVTMVVEKSGGQDWYERQSVGNSVFYRVRPEFASAWKALNE